MLTSRVVTDGCVHSTSDAQVAWDSGEFWSKGKLILKANRGYILSIKPESNPYGGGTMAIRARYESGESIADSLLASSGKRQKPHQRSSGKKASRRTSSERCPF